MSQLKVQITAVLLVVGCFFWGWRGEVMKTGVRSLLAFRASSSSSASSSSANAVVPAPGGAPPAASSAAVVPPPPPRQPPLAGPPSPEQVRSAIGQTIDAIRPGEQQNEQIEANRTEYLNQLHDRMRELRGEAAHDRPPGGAPPGPPPAGSGPNAAGVAGPVGRPPGPQVMTPVENTDESAETSDAEDATLEADTPEDDTAVVETPGDEETTDDTAEEPEIGINDADLDMAEKK